MGVFWFFKRITGVKQKIMKKIYHLLKYLILFTFKVMILNFILLIYLLAKRKNLILKIIKPNLFLIIKNLILIINKKKNRSLNNKLFYLNKFILNKV